ncbi:MAG: hypothetical protein VKK42_13685, partial [Lyngbya sp.]|nr:hypothetical protein [Lyngbya sp.]
KNPRQLRPNPSVKKAKIPDNFAQTHPLKKQKSPTTSPKPIRYQKAQTTHNQPIRYNIRYQKCPYLPLI